MTNFDPKTPADPAPMVRPFPRPGQRVHNAYRELHLAVNGTVEQKQALGPAAQLPRPWDPSTCANPDLRRQLWAWIDDFVLWLNHEHAWDLAGMIPTCWPQHPHLVRELAVLADQRRRAALALNSDPLEDWHRYALPSFAERMRTRIGNHCEEGHQAWPGRGRYTRATSLDQRRKRQEVFAADAGGPSRPPAHGDPVQLPGFRLHIIDGDLVDVDTGEVQGPT